MIRVVLLCSALAAVRAEDPRLAGTDGPKPAAEASKDVPATDDARAKTLASYNALKDKTPETAAGQWKLALWCEQNGLPVEANTHFAAVVKLDPKREAAWHKLGYKKFDGRWLNDDQIAAEEEQKKADKEWAARLKKIHKDIHAGGKKQDQAQVVLDAITDPKAIPAVYREFSGGSALDQTIAVQLFGQIDSVLASKTLALISVYGRTAEVRRRATETLRGRRDVEYLDVLVELMTDPMKYEVKPVGGPGSPGVLLVEGERFNVRRFYAPPTPNIAPRLGDLITYDEFGMPVITRSTGQVLRSTPIKGAKGLVLQTEIGMRFSATQMMLEAQRGAAVAEAQLENDLAQIESINDDRQRFNELVMAVAKDATGKDRGRTAKEWRTALAAEKKYVKGPTREPEKPTLNQMVPIDYNPSFGQLTYMQRPVKDH